MWPFKSKVEPKLYHRVDDLYRNFKYVIPVNPEYRAWWHFNLPLSNASIWAMEYQCEILSDRVLWNEWSKRWESNGIGGEDLVFFATNDDEAATMTILRWT